MHIHRVYLRWSTCMTFRQRRPHQGKDIHHPPSDHRCSPRFRSYHGDRVFMRWLSLSEAGQRSEGWPPGWQGLGAAPESPGHGQTHDIAPRLGLNQQICDQWRSNWRTRDPWDKLQKQEPERMKLDLSVILIDQFPEAREWMFRNSRPSKWKIVQLWFWEGFI